MKKSKPKKHRLFFFLIILILILIFILFGAKIYLYANLILGNDIIVKLDVDKQDIALLHGQEEKIKFQAKVSTNPFCSASCNSAFLDISGNKTIEVDKFNLMPEIPFDKEYNLKSPGTGTGILLYRFDMACKSIKTYYAIHMKSHSQEAS